MDGACDLVVLAAGKDEEHAVRGLLSRPEAVGIRTVSSKIIVHPQHDPGCLNDAPELLRGFARSCSKALVIFDREGCGRESEPRENLERDVEARVGAAGWPGRVAAITIDPELETWVWSTSPEVDAVLGWAGAEVALRPWLQSEGHWAEEDIKPARPKEAYERAIRRVNKPKSAATFEQLGRRVSTVRCTDPAFVKLRTTLRKWFPAETGTRA